MPTIIRRIDSSPRRGLIFVSMLLFSGCAGVDPQPDYDRVAAHVETATGIEALYSPGEEEACERKTLELLKDGLTAAEAVQVSLLNNPRLQARFFEIGIARADVVQSGLLSNPSLSMALRLPTGNGSSVFDAHLVENLAALWQVPSRKRAATARLDQAVLELAREVSVLASATKAAYFRAVGARRLLETVRENLDIAQRLLDVALARQQAGAGNEVDVVLARSELLEVELSVKTASLEASQAAQDLAVLVGLTLPPTDLLLNDPLPDPVDAALSVEHALLLAREKRLDLRAAEGAIESARAAWENERLRVLPIVDIGIDAEDDSGLTVGPSVGLELPIFDQNRARIAKALYAYRETEKLLRALTTDITQEIHGAVARWKTVSEVTRFYRDQLLPLRQGSLELIREAYRSGQAPFLAVLEAERRLLLARRNYVEALRDSSLAIAGLEAATGLPFPRLLVLERRETGDEKRSRDD